MPSHCDNPDTKQPEPMRYFGGDDWFCPVCVARARFCKQCLEDIPKGVQTKSLYLVCKHYKDDNGQSNHEIF